MSTTYPPGDDVAHDTVHKALQAMTDEQLNELQCRVADLVEEFAPATEETLSKWWETPQGEFLFWQAILPISHERSNRREAEDNARIQLDANGHEVTVAFDHVVHERTGAGYYAFCHCEQGEWVLASDEWYVATEDEARAVGQVHVDETGGQWSEGGEHYPPR